MITGFGFGPARTQDQPLAETCFALRRSPHPGLASVGLPACGPDVVDKGFEGHALHQTWWRADGAGHLPTAAPEPRAVAQAAPTLAGGRTPDRGDRVGEALAYLPPRSRTAPGPQRISGALGGKGGAT